MPRALALAPALLLAGFIHVIHAEEPAAENSVVKESSAKESATPEAAEAKSIVDAAGLEWKTNYSEAYYSAKKHKRMLLINFVGPTCATQQRDAEEYIAKYPAMQSRLSRVERLRLPVQATVTGDAKSARILSFPAFTEMQNGPGFVLVDLKHVGAPYYGNAVNVLPFTYGKYYRWRSDYLAVALDLPPGSLTQRTMIWAVRIHPEAPASTVGAFHPTLASGATYHSAYQANIGVQGHHNFESRYHGLTAAGGEVSEVVAESWPGQNMIDSCIDCVHSWRHSSGHWNGVRRRHRAFGYDIRRGRNGIWYGTGIFAD
jgi:hypothetical protein